MQGCGQAGLLGRVRFDIVKLFLEERPCMAQENQNANTVSVAIENPTSALEQLQARIIAVRDSL